MEEKRFTSPVKSDSTGLPSLQFSGGRPVAFRGSEWPSFRSKLWLNKWFVLAWSLGFTLVALMLSAVRPPLYKTQTSIELQVPGSSDAQSRAAETTVPVSAEAYIQTQIRIIQSRTLLERVVAKLNDAERSRLLDSPRFWWNRPTNEKNIESILHRLSAQPSEQAGIVDIGFLSPDPIAGAHFLNSLVLELADYNVERDWHARQRKSDWNNRHLEELRHKWEESEQILAEYTKTSAKSGVSKIATGNGKPVRTHITRRMTSANAAAAEANDVKLRQLKSHLGDIEKQIAQWQSLYGATTPTVLILKSDAATTAAAIRERRTLLRANLASRRTPDPTADDPTESTIPMSYALSNTPSLRSETLTHLDILRQDADSSRQMYQATAARINEANLAGISHVGDISVVDPAIPVSKSATLSQLQSGTIGALLGLGTGLAFLALRDHFSRTFSEPMLLSRYLGLDVIGAIPADRFHEPTNGFEKSNDEPVLNLAFDTDPRTAEAYRAIRSSILLRTGERSGPRRLVFTSAGASEGTTSVVGNLGAALASAQRRVLLVDGDLRNPTLHKIFGADNEHGLTDLLTRQLSVSPIATRDVIRETQIPDLYLLSAGQAGARAPEILSSAQLPTLIREFAKGFDIVLIDSPPVVPYADARSLARAADAVILVVKAGATDRRDAMLARDAISQDGAAIIGTILTDLDSSKSMSS